MKDLAYMDNSAHIHTRFQGASDDPTRWYTFLEDSFHVNGERAALVAGYAIPWSDKPLPAGGHASGFVLDFSRAP